MNSREKEISKNIPDPGTSVAVVSALLIAYPDGARIQDKNGDLPLHYAAEIDASVDVVSVLLNAYPGGAQIKDNQGNLPLHYNRNIDVDSVLLNAYPGGAQIKNQAGYLPLHEAVCDLDVSVDVVSALLSAYPGGAQVTRKGGTLALHDAVRFADHDVISALLGAYPDGVRVKDNDGRLPLHTVLDNEFVHDDRVSVVLSAYPGGAQVQDIRGWLPLHYLADQAFDECDADSCLKICVELLRVYRAGAQLTNNDGLLPLQVALQVNENPFRDIIIRLYEAHPAGASVLNDEERERLTAIVLEGKKHQYATGHNYHAENHAEEASDVDSNYAGAANKRKRGDGGIEHLRKVWETCKANRDSLLRSWEKCKGLGAIAEKLEKRLTACLDEEKAAFDAYNKLAMESVVWPKRHCSEEAPKQSDGGAEAA
ncbi:hypothetical protein PPROV_000587900 [Pycnococcus provasolii]|uniref:Uncharacterized protein n=1 Tax=Pycnococcus provasolii TaxID=41880 RepID=A0A830HIG5_9CHLO|nr:hypothetical protein PPROV_000587900 [Pycnococcus provasolii]